MFFWEYGIKEKKLGETHLMAAKISGTGESSEDWRREKKDIEGVMVYFACLETLNVKIAG